MSYLENFEVSAETRLTFSYFSEQGL